MTKFRIFLVLLQLLCLVACNRTAPECGPISLEKFYELEGEYTLICNGCSKDCIGKHNFIELAYSYFDRLTKKERQNIIGIWFLSDDIDFKGFTPTAQNIGEFIRKNSIVHVYFEVNPYVNDSNKYPKLSSITYYINSVEYEIDLQYYYKMINTGPDTNKFKLYQIKIK